MLLNRSSKRSYWIIGVLALVVAAMIGVGIAQSRNDGPTSDYKPVVFRADPNNPTDTTIDKLQTQLRDDPENFTDNITLASAYLQKARETGDPTLYTKAALLLDRAVKADPQNPDLFAARSELALARHDFAAAQTLARQALILNPESARYYGLLGDAQIELGLYDYAVKSYQEMVNRKPEFTAYTRVAHARELHGDPEGAQEAMEFAVGAGSSVPENLAWARVQLGNLHLNLNNTVAAGEQYTAARAFPHYPPALAAKRGRGRCRKLDDAASLYTRAFNQSPLAEYAIALGDVCTVGGRGACNATVRTRERDGQAPREAGVNTDLETALFLPTTTRTCPWRCNARKPSTRRDRQYMPPMWSPGHCIRAAEARRPGSTRNGRSSSTPAIHCYSSTPV
ncbi:MAG: tetratricopeptide repeat protein [Chloroflexia bacterium]